MINLFDYEKEKEIFIDREAWEIIYLVASVCPSVRPSVLCQHSHG